MVKHSEGFQKIVWLIYELKIESDLDNQIKIVKLIYEEIDKIRNATE